MSGYVRAALCVASLAIAAPAVAGPVTVDNGSQWQTISGQQIDTPGGTDFMITSGATGWPPNRAAYFTASSLAGPWTGPTPFGHPNTFNSQSTHILAAQESMGTSYLYMGDRRGPVIGNHAQFVFQHSGPCLARDSDAKARANAVQTSCLIVPRPQWTYNGATLVNRVSSDCLDVASGSRLINASIITYSCNGGGNQKWTMIQ